MESNSKAVQCFLRFAVLYPHEQREISLRRLNSEIFVKILELTFPPLNSAGQPAVHPPRVLGPRPALLTAGKNS